MRGLRGCIRTGGRFARRDRSYRSPPTGRTSKPHPPILGKGCSTLFVAVIAFCGGLGCIFKIGVWFLEAVHGVATMDYAHYHGPRPIVQAWDAGPEERKRVFGREARFIETNTVEVGLSTYERLVRLVPAVAVVVIPVLMWRTSKHGTPAQREKEER